MSITEKAQKLVDSYDAAVRAGDGRKIGSFYGTETSPLISFALGYIHTMANTNEAEEQVHTHVERMRKAFGFNMWLKSSKIDVVSDSAAICHLTWEIKPKEEAKMEGWIWTNQYGYRTSGAEDVGHWEYIVSDDEVRGFMKRRPDFMQL